MSCNEIVPLKENALYSSFSSHVFGVCGRDTRSFSVVFFPIMFTEELHSEPACVMCVRATGIVVVYPYISGQIAGSHTPSVGLPEIKFGHISYF